MTVLQQLGVLASVMEASHLFVLALVHSTIALAPVHGGAILAIVGDGESASSDTIQSGEKRAIAMAIVAAKAMVSCDE